LPTPRPRIPSKIQTEILYRTDHTCCICRRERRVIIHHINGNPRNNKPDNLAVVCLPCHDLVTGTGGLTRSISTAEVRKFKRAWEKQVQDSRGVHRAQIRYKKELISQIDIIICEILACRPDNPHVEELLNVLYELHLWRGGQEIDRKIIEGLHHLALMSGLDSPRLATLVAEKLWQLCWHFVGPHEVHMDERDEAQVLKCIDALETLAEFNCEFGHGRKTICSITEYAENFFEIGLWYSKRQVVNEIIQAYKKAIQGCFADGHIEFPYGRRVLRRSARKLLGLLTEYRPSWFHQHNKLQEILAL
jgi:hypothetical protein